MNFDLLLIPEWNETDYKFSSWKYPINTDEPTVEVNKDTRHTLRTPWG